MPQRTLFLVLVLLLLINFVIWSGDRSYKSSYKSTENYQQRVIDFLEDKPYVADKRELTAKDLEIDQELNDALEIVGLSLHTLLRNEPFARHGYRFKDDVLRQIYSATDWYKENPNFQFSQLSKLESKNVEFIKREEQEGDYRIVVAELEEYLRYAPPGIDKVRFFSVDEWEPSHQGQMALNHLRINRSRLMRNLVFAKKGYKFKDPVLKEIFARVEWYRGVEPDIAKITRGMSAKEFVDIELLRKKEWLEILDAVNFTLPKDVISVPTIGFNAIFVKKLNYKGESYRYSSQFIHEVGQVNAKIFDDHKTDGESLVAPGVVDKIKAAASPEAKLKLFFEHKKYKGYVDKVAFNHSDMTPPSYLQQAVKDYGVDYRVLLRKEIHARAGARFTDPKSGAIFTGASWYSPRYDLTPKTVSRLPAGAKITRKEIRNFALLEGDELAEKVEKAGSAKVVSDLNGNTYYIKTGQTTVAAVASRPIKLGTAFTSLKDYESTPLQEEIDRIFQKFSFDVDAYMQEELKYINIGC